MTGAALHSGHRELADITESWRWCCLVSLPVTACVETALCRWTASVTTVTVYRVPGCRPANSVEVVVFFSVMFFNRTSY